MARTTSAVASDSMPSTTARAQCVRHGDHRLDELSVTVPLQEVGHKGSVHLHLVECPRLEMQNARVPDSEVIE